MLRRAIVVTLVVAVGFTLGVTGWRACGPYGATCSDAGQYFPMHDTDTHLLSGVVYDLTGDGVVETFISMGAAGITDVMVDADEDGEIDHRLQPDRDGTLQQVDMPQTEPSSREKAQSASQRGAYR